MFPQIIESVSRFRFRQAQTLLRFEQLCARRFATDPAGRQALVDQFWRLDEMRDHGSQSPYADQFVAEISNRCGLDTPQAQAITICYHLLEPTRVLSSRRAILAGRTVHHPLMQKQHLPVSHDYEEIYRAGRAICDGHEYSTWRCSYGSCSAMPVFQYLSGLSHVKRDNLSACLTAVNQRLEEARRQAEEGFLTPPLTEQTIAYLSMAFFHAFTSPASHRESFCPPELHQEFQALSTNHDHTILKQLAQTTSWLFITAQSDDRQKMINALFPQRCQAERTQFLRLISQDSCLCHD